MKMEDVRPGVHSVLVDRLSNPDDPTDVADIYEEIVLIDPLGPCVAIHTQNHRMIVKSDTDVEILGEDDASSGDQ